MSDPWEEAETDIPEFMKDPDYYKQVYDELCPAAQRGLHAVGQRIIDIFREHGMINEGTELYVNEHAMIAAVGQKPITREALSKQPPKYMWGRGSEAFIAGYVIDQRPAMKHEAWTAARKVLSEIPAHPSQAPVVIALLNSTIAKERQCWVQVATLRSADTLQSIAALNMEAILVSMCSLAGITFQGGDPIDAVEKAYYDLSDDMAMLRRYHRRLEMLSDEAEAGTATVSTDIEKQLDRFEEIWKDIVDMLFPGRLASELQCIADTMQDKIDRNKLCSPSHNEEQWQRQSTPRITYLDEKDLGMKVITASDT